VDADLKSYFDTIPKGILMERVKSRISDGCVLKLVEAYLNQSIMEEMKEWKPAAGTPQGAVLSPLLANLYLHPLDIEMAQLGYKMVRYADDFVILCQSETAAQEALSHVKKWVEANGLILHPDKTHVGNCLLTGQGFDFLGYRFEGGRREIRRKSLQALKDKIRRSTGRSRGVSMMRIIEDINPMLRGWFNYFKHAHGAIFATLDSFIRRRLRSILCKQNKKSYFFNRSKAVHQRWPNSYFAGLGLFTLKEARSVACRPR
jgi:RNA-directed DNA polymerase